MVTPNMRLRSELNSLQREVEFIFLNEEDRTSKILELISRVTGVEVENLGKAVHPNPSLAIDQSPYVPRGCHIDSDGNVRTPDGSINNCLLAKTGNEVDPNYGPCQVCGGTCPDRQKITY